MSALTYLLSVLLGVFIVVALVIIIRVILDAASVYFRDPQWLADNGLRLVSVSPEPCLFCGRVGLHHEGCSRLDRMDAGEVA